MPDIMYNKGKVEGHRLEIQDILGALNVLGSPSGENLGVHLAPTVPHDTATASASESRTSPAPPSPILDRTPVDSDSSSCLNFNALACGRLIRRAFAPHELPSLIEAIFSSKDEGDAIRGLLGDDAQTFIDMIDEARYPSAHHPGPVI